MASEEETLVYFVETPGGSKNGSNSSVTSTTAAAVPVRSEIMRAAHKSVKRRKLKPKWIDPAKVQQICEQLSAASAGGEEGTTVLSKEDIMFVLDAFEGPVYEYLSKNNYRIISPYVVKYCDEEDCPEPFETIPLRAHPVFSQCMRNLVVTATSLQTETRRALEAKVMKMCGEYNSGLNGRVKLLIAGSVLTDKYKAAVKMAIPVVRPDWVEDCWTTYQYNYVRADSPELLRRYALPVFHNLMITCSGIEISERANVKALIEENGGTYSPTLRFDVLNTILVLQQPTGDKYRYAKKKNIPRLRAEWLYDSIAANYSLPMDEYNIDCGDVSVAVVDETQMPQPNLGNEREEKSSTSSCSSSISRAQPGLNSLNNLRDLADMIDNLALSVTDRTFFDSTVILAVGFDDISTVAIKNAVRRCGAFFVADFKPMVTHVIVGPSFSSTQPLWDRLLEGNIEKIVTIDWLISSLKASECVDYFPYRYNPTQSSILSNGGSSSTNGRGSGNKNSNNTRGTNRSRLDLFSTQAENMIQMFSSEHKKEVSNNAAATNTLIAATPVVTTSSTKGATPRKKKKVADEEVVECTTPKTRATRANGRAVSPTPSQTTRSTTNSKSTKSSRPPSSTQNFRSLVSGAESDDDEPVIWSPNSKHKPKVFDEEDEETVNSQKSAKQMVTLRSNSNRLRKKLAESDEEEEESQSLSTVGSSRKRTIGTSYDSEDDDDDDSIDEDVDEEDDEEDDEVDDSCVEILDTNDLSTNKVVSGSRVSGLPTLNLNKKPHSANSSTSVGILSTQPNEREAKNGNSVDEEVVDSIDDYIEDDGMTGDTATDEEDEVSYADAIVASMKVNTLSVGVSTTPLFMFSGFEENIREEMSTKAKTILGVGVHEESTVLPTVTHLILREPFATEKTLSAIAGGVWILVPEFVHRSLEAGRLLPEAEFEWSAQNLSAYSKTSSRRKLMLAATAWRKYFTKIGSKGAFLDWSILMLNKSSQMDSMLNILTAGRAEVFDLEKYSHPFEDIVGMIPLMKYAIFDKKGFINSLTSNGGTHQAFCPKNLTREQFVKVLGFFAEHRKLVPQEAITRYLLTAKPEEDIEDSPGSLFFEKEAITSSQLKTILKEMK